MLVKEVPVMKHSVDHLVRNDKAYKPRTAWDVPFHKRTRVDALKGTTKISG